MLTSNNSRLVNSFFNERLGLHLSADFRGVLYVPEECRNDVATMDAVAVAVGYNAFIGRTCCIHTVIQRPELFTARVIREAFEFPFEVCGCQAVLALVDSVNDASLRLTDKLGFTEIARVPNGGTEGDLVVLRMLRDECRWLRKPH